MLYPHKQTNPCTLLGFSASQILTPRLTLHSRVVGSDSQTVALVSVILFVFVVCSHYKRPKYLRREFNYVHCLRHFFFMDIATVIMLSYGYCLSHNFCMDITSVISNYNIFPGCGLACIVSRKFFSAFSPTSRAA